MTNSWNKFSLRWTPYYITTAEKGEVSQNVGCLPTFLQIVKKILQSVLVCLQFSYIGNFFTSTISFRLIVEEVTTLDKLSRRMRWYRFCCMDSWKALGTKLESVADEMNSRMENWMYGAFLNQV